MQEITKDFLTFLTYKKHFHIDFSRSKAIPNNVSRETLLGIAGYYFDMRIVISTV